MHLFTANYPYLRELTRFSLPIIMGSAGNILLIVLNSLMAGRYNTDTVAALTIANGIMGPLFMMGLGQIMNSPILAKKCGEGEEIDKYLVTSLLISLVVGISITTLVYITIPFLSILNPDPKLIPLIKQHLIYFGLSIIFAMLFNALKEHLQAKKNVLVPNSLSLFGAFLNVILVYLLCFKLNLNILGIALSGLVVRALIFLLLLIYTSKKCTFYFKIIPHFIKEEFRFGFPVALAMVAEMAAFGAISLLVAKLPINQIAAHNVILSITTLTFLFPLAIGSATSVLISHARGEGNLLRVKNFTQSALLMSVCIMTPPTLIFLLAPHFIAASFSTDLAVITIAVPLVIIAGIIQIIDGLQVTLCGILRGYGETKKPFVSMLLGFWCIGIPLGLFLQKTVGIQGYWIGILFALIFLNISLIWILFQKIKTISNFFTQPH